MVDVLVCASTLVVGASGLVRPVPVVPVVMVVVVAWTELSSVN
jgi:hypothetical protein